MHKKIYQISCTIIALTAALSLNAQNGMEDKKVEMADAMRSNGKIYVVVAVLVIILSGLILYVARLDRKISKLEQEESTR